MTERNTPPRRHFLARLAATVVGFWVVPAVARNHPDDEFDIDVRLTRGGTQIAQFEPSAAGCTATCGSTCLGTCGGTCGGTCMGTCMATCEATCMGTCQATCAATCLGTCNGSCAATCVCAPPEPSPE